MNWVQLAAEGVAPAVEAFRTEAEAVAEQARTLAESIEALGRQAAALSQSVEGAAAHAGPSPLIFGLTVLVLGIFVGYHVVWRVTPALHSPLMGVTNAISSVIIVGALIAAGPAHVSFSEVMGFIAVALASVNIFGGFIVTHRMLSMFKKKPKAAAPAAKS